jgi:hypothetical protein
MRASAALGIRGAQTKRRLAAAADVDETVMGIKRALLAILLNASGAQAGQAVLIDRILPGKEFFDRQGVATARLFQRKQSAANGSDDFGFAANHPTLRSWRREIGNRQRRTVRPDDILDPRAMGLSHSKNSHRLDNTGYDLKHGGLRFG